MAKGHESPGFTGFPGMDWSAPCFIICAMDSLVNIFDMSMPGIGEAARFFTNSSKFSTSPTSSAAVRMTLSSLPTVAPRVFESPSGSVPSPGFAESKPIFCPFISICIATRSYLIVTRLRWPSSCARTAMLMSIVVTVFCSIFCGPMVIVVPCVDCIV